MSLQPFPPSESTWQAQRQQAAFDGADALHFSCYGAQISIFANVPGILPAVMPHLPPHWMPHHTVAPTCVYRLEGKEGADGNRTYTLHLSTIPLVEDQPLAEGLERLISSLHVSVSCHAQDFLFVHAGAVGWKGRVILLPGLSHAGKTMLVKALVEAGATYYSDEFAVLDDIGRVHPYARPLAVRDEAGRVTQQTVASLGGVAGTMPLPVGLVLALQYERGAPWKPRVLSPGQGTLRLLENTVMARKRSADALRIFGRVMQDAKAWQGKRGEASEVAPLLLAHVDGRG